MAGIEDVLARVEADPAFHAEVLREPAAALSGYDLSADDVTRLSRHLDAGRPKDGVGRRVSMARFFAMVAERLAPRPGCGEADRTQPSEGIAEPDPDGH